MKETTTTEHWAVALGHGLGRFWFWVLGFHHYYHHDFYDYIRHPAEVGCFGTIWGIGTEIGGTRRFIRGMTSGLRSFF
jgi:hypothetical protein